MIDYKDFFDQLSDSNLGDLRQSLATHIDAGLSTKRFGDLTGWLDALAELPTVACNNYDLSTTVRLGTRADIGDLDFARMKTQLQRLIPWRKGPISLFGLDIDTEWRSDWKWQRVLPHLDALSDRTVLDVGCGNGYHCLRMYGEGAKRVIGIDPSPRFVVQFYMLKHFLGNIPVDVLPVTLESMPKKLATFDTVFSMGVLYHRRSPIDHLLELKDCLRPGGQLVLETLVIPGQLGETLMPEGRYAMMNNVWFIPSSLTLLSWLAKCGFEDAQRVDETITSLDEQRTTEWMTFHSLAEFLDPDDVSRTIEGHPGPMRAILTARKPS